MVGKRACCELSSSMEKREGASEKGLEEEVVDLSGDEM